MGHVLHNIMQVTHIIDNLAKTWWSGTNTLSFIHGMNFVDLASNFQKVVSHLGVVVFDESDISSYDSH